MPGLGLGTLEVLALQLEVVQLLAELDDLLALLGHFLAGKGDGVVGLAALREGSLVGFQRLTQRGQLRLMPRRQAVGELRHLAAAHRETLEHRLGDFSATTIGDIGGNVGKRRIARFAHAIQGPDDGLVLLETAFVEGRQGFHRIRQRAENRHRPLGFGRHPLPGRERSLVAGAHGVQGVLIQGDLFGLLLQHPHVDRVLVAGQGFLVQLPVGVQSHLGVFRDAIVALRHHVLQSDDAQLGQGIVELGDPGHPATALHQRADTAPADDGQQAGQQQNQPKPQTQLLRHLQIAKPLTHTYLQQRSLLDVSRDAGGLFLLKPDVVTEKP
ncbi:hypothetical protein D9M69_364610 [compost metagenome]